VLGVVLVLTALLVQLTVLTRVPLPGATPDLVLLVLVGLGLRWGPLPGAVTGFGAGLGLDLVPPADGAVGQWTLVLCVVGYAVGMFEGLADNSLVGSILVVAAAATAAPLLYAAVGAVVGDARVSWSIVVGLLPTAVIYAVVLAPFVVSAVHSLARRVEPDLARW
jgi:rod shape-determining protein MreD